MQQKIKWGAGIVFFVLLSGASHGKTMVSNEIDSLILRGIRLSIEQSYSEANDIFIDLQQRFPDHPVGYFFQAAVEQTRMMDYERYDREQLFLSLVNKTIELAKQKIATNDKNAWNYFYLGSSYGYLSFYRSKQQKYLEAYQAGRRSVDALSMAIAKDSTLYDAYLGLGTFKYYTSKLKRYFSWLPVVTDSRREGIEMIERAMNEARFSRYSAINLYCWIQVEEQEYLRGLQIVESVLQKFPDSRVFLWCAAKLNKKLKRWQEASNYYERILASFRSEGVDSPVNEVLCRKNLTQLYLKLENPDRARANCQAVDAMDLDGETKKRCSKTLKEMRETCSTDLPEIAGHEIQ